jgi:hypothetical protein
MQPWKQDVNHSNTYKQIEGRNQPMQLDSLKVLPRSTLLLLLGLWLEPKKVLL